MDAANLEFSIISKFILGIINLERNQPYNYLKPQQVQCLRSALETDTIGKIKNIAL